MENKKWKKTGISLGTFILLVFLIFWIFRDYYQEICENIKAISWTVLLLLVGMGIFYQLLEAVICYLLVKEQVPEFSFWSSIKVTYLGIFGNVSFSVGGVPMQSYYLYRCGLSAGRGVGILALKYVFHKGCILVYAEIMMLLQGGWSYIKELDIVPHVIWGYFLCIVVIIALLLVCTQEKILEFVLWGIDQLPQSEKWNRRKEEWGSQLKSLHQEVKRITHDKTAIWKMIVLNAVKFFILYTIPAICFYQMGVSGVTFWKMQLLSALMMLLANSLPNVSGMGATEFAFLAIFSSCMEAAQVSSGMILYRVSTFFLPFVLSVFVFLIVQHSILSENV
ncbi:MAG: YbhN family protein [Lachnospiraceae bacterium]